MQFRLIRFVTFSIFIIVLSSCATASFSKYKAVGRVKTYHILNKDIPLEFDGFRIAFATDFHYESRFNEKRLSALVRTLQVLDADILLLGGDYRGKKGGDVDKLFSELAKVKTEYGTYAVMGNHERDENDTLVRKAISKYKIKLLEHKVDTLYKNNKFILLCGIKNPFDLRSNGISPTLSLLSQYSEQTLPQRHPRPSSRQTGFPAFLPG